LNNEDDDDDDASVGADDDSNDDDVDNDIGDADDDDDDDDDDDGGGGSVGDGGRGTGKDHPEFAGGWEEAADADVQSAFAGVHPIDEWMWSDFGQIGN
jgi:hypothetical protein